MINGIGGDGGVGVSDELIDASASLRVEFELKLI